MLIISIILILLAQIRTGDCSVPNTGEWSGVALNQQEQQLYDYINNSRRGHVVVLDQALTRAAQLQANDEAAYDYIDHIDSSDRTPEDRAGECGAQRYAGSTREANDKYNNYSGDFYGQSLLGLPENDFVLHDYSLNRIGIGASYNANSAHQFYWVIVMQSATN